MYNYYNILHNMFAFFTLLILIQNLLYCQIYLYTPSVPYQLYNVFIYTFINLILINAPRL